MREKSTREWTRLYRKYKYHYEKQKRWAAAHNVGFYDKERLNKAQFKFRYRFTHDAFRDEVTKGERKSMPSIFKKVLGSQIYEKSWKQMKAFTIGRERYNRPLEEEIKSMIADIRKTKADYKERIFNEMQRQRRLDMIEERDKAIQQIREKIAAKEKELVKSVADWRFMRGDLRPDKELPQRFYDFLDAEYHSLRAAGKKAKEAKAIIAQNYFGSPK